MEVKWPKMKDENGKPVPTGKPSGSAYDRRKFLRKNKKQAKKEGSNV